MTRYINFDDHDRYRHARPGTEPRSWCDRWTYALSQLASAELPAYAPEDGEAYQLAGLSYPTKFSLAQMVELPYSHAWFSPPPNSPLGQTPRLGVLHPSLHRRAAAAWQAVESSNS